MKKDSFFALRVYPLLFMAAVTVVCISLVTGIFLSTEDRVRSNELLFLRMAVLEAADIAFTPGDYPQIQERFEQRVTEENGYYLVELEDGETGFVMPITGSGLWGPIEMMLGFQEDLETMTGISILSHNETPGLGARIEEAWFINQFRGKQGPFRLVAEGTADAPDEVDGITGATRTTVAVGEIINRGISQAPQTIKGE